MVSPALHSNTASSRSRSRRRRVGVGAVGVGVLGAGARVEVYQCSKPRYSRHSSIEDCSISGYSPPHGVFSFTAEGP